jgi:hypothetical protein
MVDTNKGPGADPNKPGEMPRGEALAQEMVAQLAVFNHNFAMQLQMNEKLYKQGQKLIKLQDELCGRLEVMDYACEIMAGWKKEGKIKMGIAEFAEAVEIASVEIMGDDEGEPEEQEEEEEELEEEDEDPPAPRFGRR